MSIFVTSLGATDNEICAPICQSILDQMNPKGFRFRGIPAVESQIVLNKNQVGFTLISCHLRTTPVIFGFDEVNHFLDMYKQKRKITKRLHSNVKEKLDELDQLATAECIHSPSCAHCVISSVSRELFS